MPSRFKRPLTRDQLVAIQERNKDNSDVLALPSEINRLRAVVLQADQLQRSLSGVGGGAGTMLELLRSKLKAESRVKESPRLDMGK